MNKSKIKSILHNKYFIITVLTILAFLIRLLNIDKPLGLWYDEMICYIFASKEFPFGILKALLREDCHMPLYYLYLNFWMNFLGTEDIALRLSSVIWGVLTIPALFFLGKTYRSEKLGYLLASVGCISPVLIYFSQELRFYSLLIFLSTISITYFLKLLQDKNNKNIIIFFITNLIILYIYTMGIAFVSLELLILFYDSYISKKNDLLNLSKAVLIFLILSIPYFMFLIFQIYGFSQVFADPFGSGKLSWFAPLILLNDCFSPFMTTFFNHDVQIYKLFATTPIKTLQLIFMSSSTVCFISGFIISLKNNSRNFYYLLFITTAFILIQYVLSVLDCYIILVKYTSVFLPILFLLCLDGLLLIKNKYLKISLISIIFIVFVWNIINYKETRAFEYRYGGLKPAADILMSLNPDGDYVLELERTELLKKYVKNYNFIDFDSHRVIYLDRQKKEALKIFDENFVKETNKHNSPEKLVSYFINPEPTDKFKNYINSQLNTIPKNKRFIFIEGPFYGGESDITIINQYVTNYHLGFVKRKEYKKELFFLINEKISADIKNILKNNPTLIKIDEIKMRQSYYAARNIRYNFYIYKKI